jgi:hypothetical protein
VGDVYIFKDIPIPHGAHIVSMVFGGVQETTSTTSVSHVFTLGLNYNGSTDYRTRWPNANVVSAAFWDSVDYCVTYAATAGAADPYPVKVSVSDDRVDRFVYPIVNYASGSYGSATGSMTVRLAMKVTYTMDI